MAKATQMQVLAGAVGEQCGGRRNPDKGNAERKKSALPGEVFTPGVAPMAASPKAQDQHEQAGADTNSNIDR